VRYDALYEEITINAIFFSAGTISSVKISKESQRYISFYDDELVAMISKPFSLMGFIELKLGGEAGWRSCTHIHSTLMMR